MHGADRLKAWMGRAKLTQREAARLFGIHYTYLNQILSGRRVPALAHAVTIERETGIPVEVWLPSRDGKARKASRSDRGNLKLA